jgi:putative hydrolase of HD superfamily
MTLSDLQGILEFLRRAEQLKDTLRSGYTTGGRPESAAEHTWRLCLMAWMLSPSFPEIAFDRLVKMCLVHDLGETLRGDVPAPEQITGDDRTAAEREDLRQILTPLPEALRAEALDLWDEYARAESPTARLAKGLDKLETILQHTQGRNPPGFDYRFNLVYGREHTAEDPVLDSLRRVLDEETERRARDAERRE